MRSLLTVVYNYYNELCVCGNVTRNTHSIGNNKYFSKYLHV